jgi:hypothetical protein
MAPSVGALRVDDPYVAAQTINHGPCNGSSPVATTVHVLVGDPDTPVSQLVVTMQFTTAGVSVTVHATRVGNTNEFVARYGPFRNIAGPHVIPVQIKVTAKDPAGNSAIATDGTSLEFINC